MNEVIDHLPRKGSGRGSTMLPSHNSVADRQKWSGSVGAECPNDPATSIEFANLLMKVAPDSQSLCASALGDEGYLITLNLEVTKDLSLRALVDCGASNNFVRRQSLEDRRLKFVERVTPPKSLTVRLATGAYIAVIKRVVGFHYTLEDLQYNDVFIVLDLNTNLMSS